LNARRVVAAFSPFAARRFGSIGTGFRRTGPWFRRLLTWLPDFWACLRASGLSSFGSRRTALLLVERGDFTAGSGGRGIFPGRSSFESLAEPFGNPQFLFDRLPQLLRTAAVLFLRDAGFAEIPQFMRLLDELLPSPGIQSFETERVIAWRLDQRSQ